MGSLKMAAATVAERAPGFSGHADGDTEGPYVGGTAAVLPACFCACILVYVILCLLVPLLYLRCFFVLACFCASLLL